MACSASSSTSHRFRAEARARDRAARASRIAVDFLAVKPRSTKTFDRDSSAALTSNDGILGRRADEHDVAGFDARQKRVLLRLVEAVDLVDEDDRAPARRAAQALGVGHHLADFLDAGEHGAERDEAGLASSRR